MRTAGGAHFRWQTGSARPFPKTFHSAIPTLRTAQAACLHRLSTRLCTAQIAACGDALKTVSGFR